MGEKGKGSVCGKVTKGIARGEAGMPCKGKSTGKKVEKSGGRGGNMHCHTIQQFRQYK